MVPSPIQKWMNKKEKYSVEYPNIPSDIRPLPNCKGPRLIQVISLLCPASLQKYNNFFSNQIQFRNLNATLMSCIADFTKKMYFRFRNRTQLKICCTVYLVFSPNYIRPLPLHKPARCLLCRNHQVCPRQQSLYPFQRRLLSRDTKHTNQFDFIVMKTIGKEATYETVFLC